MSFFVGDPCLDRADTSTIDIQVACFRACLSTVLVVTKSNGAHDPARR